MRRGQCAISVDSMNEKKRQHPMIFRCVRCGKEHRPKPGTWVEQSVEIGKLGWVYRYEEGVLAPGYPRDYQLRCGAKECAATA
jgi:hypothetical protein